MNRHMVTAYVEKLLTEITGNDKVFTDADGDYPFRYKDAAYYVRLTGTDDSPVVQVFSIALAGVEAGPDLYQALNDINARIHYCRCFHIGDQVLFEDEVDAEALNVAALDVTIREVAEASNYFGPELRERFGGILAFDESKGPEHEPVELGLYL